MIENYQKGDQTQFEKIYKVFEKLICCYSYRLKNDDDIFQELNVFFVELLRQLSLNRFHPDQSTGLQQYVAVCIRNKYISYSKLKQTRETFFTDYCEEISVQQSETELLEWRVLLSEGLARLTAKQKQVILYKYVQGYSDAEISQMLHITRQAVNRLKTRGLLLLRDFLQK